MMPRSIVEPGPSLCCPGKDHAYRRCPVSRDDAALDCRARTVPLLSKEGPFRWPMPRSIAEEQFPAVAAAVDEPGVRAACTDAAATNQNYFEFLLRLAESELATALPLRSRGGSKTETVASFLVDSAVR